MGRNIWGPVKTLALEVNTRIILLILVLGLAVYWPTLNNGFVTMDDPGYVTENPMVLQGLSLATLKWAFTTFTMSNWHPMTWLSHLLDSSLFGLDPWGHHLTSLLFHITNSILLFLFLKRATGRTLRGAVVALIFLVHPMHVESVSWVSERKDVLCAFFFLLSIHLYVSYVRQSKWYLYFAVVAAFTASLLSKPMSVTLPFVLLLLDYWPLRRMSSPLPTKKLFIEKVPFFLLSAVISEVTLSAQDASRAVNPLGKLPFLTKFENSVTAYGSYLWKSFFPRELVALYPFSKEIPTVYFATATVVIIALTYYVIRRRDVFPYLIPGWFWFIGMLVPVIGLIQVGGQAMADRYTYLPHIGLFLAITWYAGDFAERCNLRLLCAAICTLFVVFLSVITFNQISYWKDGPTLFYHVIKAYPQSQLAHYHLGMALTKQGKYEEAAEHYTKCIALAPEVPQPHFGLAFALFQLGFVERAISSFERAIALDQKNDDFKQYLQVALTERNRLEDHLQKLSSEAAKAPNDDRIQVEWAKTLVKLERKSEARDHLLHARQLNPQNRDISYYLSLAQ